MITYLIHVEDHWHLFGHAGEVWSYLNLLDFQRCLHYLYCCCWGYTVVVNVVVVAAVAAAVVAVVDGLIHSKSGYPEKVKYSMLVKNHENRYILSNVIASQNLSMEHNFFQIKVTDIWHMWVIFPSHLKKCWICRNNFN